MRRALAGLLVVGAALLACKNKGQSDGADARAPSPPSAVAAPSAVPSSASSGAKAPARGVVVTVKNQMSKTVKDVVLEYKGGSAKIPSVAAGSAVDKTVPRAPNSLTFVDGTGRRITNKNQFEMDGNQGVLKIDITPKGTVIWDVQSLNTVD